MMPKKFRPENLMTHDELVAKVADLRDMVRQLLNLIYRQRDMLDAWERVLTRGPGLLARLRVWTRDRVRRLKSHSEGGDET